LRYFSNIAIKYLDITNTDFPNFNLKYVHIYIYSTSAPTLLVITKSQLISLTILLTSSN
jgi:hypothetical protein